MSKLNYKIKYLESKDMSQTGGSDIAYIETLQKNQDSLEQNPPQNDIKNDPDQHKVYSDILNTNSVKLDILNVPLGTTTDRTDGNLYFKGVWVVKIGYQYKIINDNTLIEKLNRFEKAPNGVITHKNISYSFKDGHWNIMHKGSEKYMEVPTFPVYFINFDTGEKH